MVILLLGSGGREHALAWKLAQSEKCTKLYVAPGNGGTGDAGENVDLDPTDFEGVAAFVINYEVGMVVVGPEVPLVEGLGDYFAAHSLLKDVSFIGPSKAGAQLEGSKEFAKRFMLRHGIPTARYESFGADELEAAQTFLKTLAAPYVLKADGLAAGKGVLICETLEEAQQGLGELLGGKFGAASRRVVIEEYMEGVECSVFALTDGKSYKILPAAKDYKRIGEGDTGLNTGGMGSVSPVPFATAEWMARVEECIVRPTVEGLRADGIPYKGFIFFGLMNCADGPKVIEYNCRMGDPETETVMLRLQADLVDLLDGVAHGTLDQKTIAEDPRAAACVMLVSGGYPEHYGKGFDIRLPEDPKAIYFHAGTALKDGRLLTAGGRVLAVSCYGDTLAEAVGAAEAEAARIGFEGCYYRRDIGQDLLR